MNRSGLRPRPYRRRRRRGTVTVSRDLPEDIQDTLATTFNATPTRATAYPNRFACPIATLHDLVENDHYGTTEIIHPWADAVAVE